MKFDFFYLDYLKKESKKINFFSIYYCIIYSNVYNTHDTLKNIDNKESGVSFMIEDTQLKNVLSDFGIYVKSSIKQIYETAWDIDDAYILKVNEDIKWLEKSIITNRLLISEGITVAEYIDTIYGKQHLLIDEKYWCLMKKIKGSLFDPYAGDLKNNGILLGKAVARLHKALKNVEDKLDIDEADFDNELSSWIVPELEKNGVSFKEGVIDSLYAFFAQDYKNLPRQLIHRDMHTGNLLYQNGSFSYLDFDLGQSNVRIFDIVYLGCSQLVENYKDQTGLKQWRKIFEGIVQGYNEISPLSREELNALPALFVFDEALFTAFYLKTGQPEIAKNCEEMTNWLHDNIRTLIL